MRDNVIQRVEGPHQPGVEVTEVKITIKDVFFPSSSKKEAPPSFTGGAESKPDR